MQQIRRRHDCFYSKLTNRTKNNALSSSTLTYWLCQHNSVVSIITNCKVCSVCNVNTKQNKNMIKRKIFKTRPPRKK